ncbi:hypothetical protein DPMN_185732 [Dreissena polymorpha]|uniref:Uncharacterized protein n=1 Tax=Dreissena polymorpha TaxID=45954 RepID=A0A9D4DLG5_DREPO|nr:hypothetical protein DPMN_185732 [Dreissena polymorpha]
MSRVPPGSLIRKVGHYALALRQPDPHPDRNFNPPGRSCYLWTPHQPDPRLARKFHLSGRSACAWPPCHRGSQREYQSQRGLSNRATGLYAVAMICRITWRNSGGLHRKFDVVNACTLARSRHDLLSYVRFTFLVLIVRPEVTVCPDGITSPETV